MEAEATIPDQQTNKETHKSYSNQNNNSNNSQIKNKNHNAAFNQIICSKCNSFIRQ
jgi:hypothetical protein